jgi:O-phospho-L-seryl-tRNASec:L-selenocysteinyl-tRNA synthase
VQSTDKNFLVPVGGAIVASTSPAFLKLISSCYPGRASVAPILDLFITLLSMGETGYRNLLEERKRNLTVFQMKLSEFCGRHSLSMIASPRNSISFAVNINHLPHHQKSYTFFGSMLFQRCISGCRVIDCRNPSPKNFNGFAFSNWGSHLDNFPNSYFTAACAIGMKFEEIDLFLSRLEKVMTKFQKINSVKLKIVPDEEILVFEEGRSEELSK